MRLAKKSLLCMQKKFGLHWKEVFYVWTGSYHLYRRCQSRTTISITIKKNDYLCRTLGRNMTEGLAVLIIANVANAMKTIKAVTANKGKCWPLPELNRWWNNSFFSQCCACSAYSCRHNNWRTMMRHAFPF